MMTVSQLPTSSALRKFKAELKSVNLQPKRVLEILPDWWEEALLEPSGLYEIRGFVAKHFGLATNHEGFLELKSLPEARFKTRAGLKLADIAPARAMATAVASIIARAVLPTNRTPIGPDATLPKAAALRHELLKETPDGVSLVSLLEACWAYRIPVVYLPDLPLNSVKMDGMVTFCHGRFVIVITKKITGDYPAWLLFPLAHELGHIACRHLEPKEGNALVDEKISEESDFDDAQENEANKYAIELLSGGKNLKINTLERADFTASAAIRYGQKNQIEPGHVILNAASNSTFSGKSPWPLANAALKKLYREDQKASILIKSHLIKNIDQDKLTNNNIDFLEKIGII